jgi:hypothetical protein
MKMQGITKKGGVVFYYGNPAGYVNKKNAIMDSIFQNEELESWLQKKGLVPKWTDGVMERLLAGEQFTGSMEGAAPLKNVRIWQLKPETDVHMKFICLDEMLSQYGELSPEHYGIVYDGQLETNDLEAIYTRCNTNHPPGYRGHSLSMSDVVELYDEEGSEYHYCDRFGFKQIAFEEGGQIQGMAESMSQSF